MKKIAVVVLMLVILVAGGWLLLGNKPKEQPTGTGVSVEKKTGLVSVVENGSSYEIWLDVGVKKVSMVDVTMRSSKVKISGVEVNATVFNSEMQNKIADSGEWRLTLGVMKATKDLPSGKILVGKIGFDGKGDTELNVEKSKITYGGEGTEMPEEVEVSDFTKELKIK